MSNTCVCCGAQIPEGTHFCSNCGGGIKPQNRYDKFLRLVQENPTLPIVPMVSYDVVDDDSYHWWLGSFVDCEITEYTCVEMYNEDRFVTRDDIDEIEEYFMNEFLDDNEELSDKEIERMAHEQAEALDWKKAIVIWVGTP